MSKLTADEALCGLAASVTGRACELIMDGWTKGRMSAGFDKVEQFCIHGALDLAMEEIFGTRSKRSEVVKAVETLATAFICDEAFGGTKTRFWAAGYNDAAERRHDEVTGVLDRASNRLWALAVPNDDAEYKFEYSQYADVEPAQAQQMLYATLGN